MQKKSIDLEPRKKNFVVSVHVLYSYIHVKICQETSKLHNKICSEKLKITSTD